MIIWRYFQELEGQVAFFRLQEESSKGIWYIVSISVHIPSKLHTEDTIISQYFVTKRNIHKVMFSLWSHRLPIMKYSAQKSTQINGVDES